MWGFEIVATDAVVLPAYTGSTFDLHHFNRFGALARL
jgi:hypothetical protein